MWQNVKNALVPRRSREEELRDERNEWRDEAKEYKERYFDLQDEHDELKEDYFNLKQKVSDLENQLQAKNQVLEDEASSGDTDEVGEDLTPRESQLFKVITNNAESIDRKSDVLDMVKKQIGVEWKESTLDVYLSRIKKKGKGDLRRFF